jgi:hypothetical protein
MAKGIDYAFHPHPPLEIVKAAGVEFVGRYISSFAPNDANGKNLIPAEKDEILRLGLRIVLFVEEGADRMLGGKPAGIADAQHAVAVAKALGLDGIPLYYACDFDATEAQQRQISDYMDGVLSVHGLERAGFYGGYYTVKRTLDAGKAKYACQTRAWSGGQTDHRASILQLDAINVGGVSVDYDESTTADYGQWPRLQAVSGGGPASSAGPGLNWTETLVQTLPTLAQGASGEDVKTLQGALIARGHAVKVDGSFGPATRTAVMAAQRSFGFTGPDVDGKAGPKTWPKLLNR